MMAHSPFGKYISRMYRLVQKEMDEKLRPYHIRITQYSILRYLFGRNSASQEAIARDLHIDKALCSREVRKLEEAGYLVRVRNPDDNREFRVTLTEQGMAREADLVKIGKDLNDTILAGFSPGEEDAIYRLAERIIGNLEHAGGLSDENNQ